MTPISHGTLFSDRIIQEKLPHNFRPLQVDDYNGIVDQEEHLGHFENFALLHQYSNGVKCQIFLTTLVRSAQQWFKAFLSGFICSFDDFATFFSTSFFQLQEVSTCAPYFV